MRSIQSVFLTLLCLAFALSSQAQTINGSISGKVMDSSGAMIPNARVLVRNLETGITRDAVTDDAGIYRVRALAVGHYAISYTADGFETLVRQPIEIQMSVDVGIDISLKPGANQTVVSVTGEAPLIEATQSQVSKGVEKTAIMELPGLNTLNGLALLQAGAMVNNNGRPGSGFAINGGRSRSNNFTIDGANNNDQSLSTPRLNLTPEYLDQFRIITNGFAAEYGRNSGSVVTQITKSGSNDFHGTERWTWTGNGLDSLSTGAKRTFNSYKSQGLSDYLALRKSRAVVVENLGVLSLGGPIKKDKSFFYAGYDVDRYRTTAVPTTVAISPDSFNQLKGVQGQFATGALDFLQKTFPLANDPTPRGTLGVLKPDGTPVLQADGSKLVLNLQQLSPGLVAPLSYATNSYRWIVKNDTKLNSKSNLTTRYVIQESADPGAPTGNPLNRVGQNLRDQSLTFNDTYVLTPTMLNEGRFTYTRRGINFPENFPQYVSISGFTSVGNTSYPQHRTDNGYEFTDNVSLVHGRHTLKTGFNLYHVNLYSFFPANLMGSVTYPSISSLLFDQQGTFSKYTGTPDFTAITNELGAFFQDDFRVKPNFTLNMGLRYEFDSAPFGYWSGAKPDINNFGPRFGFGWNPQATGGPMEKILGNGKTAVRGGFSMTYDQIFQNVLLNVFRNYPRGINYSYGPVTGQGLYLPSNQPTVPTPQQYAQSGLNVDLLDYRNWCTNTRIAQPYSMQFTFGLERQIHENYVVKLFYIGTRGVKLMREQETNYGFYKAAVDANPSTYAGVINNLKLVNSIPAPQSINQPVYRVNPAIGGRGVGSGMAMSTYHSLQATFEKRFSGGFQFQANYTWSSFIDDADDILGGANNSTIPAVPFNYKLDKSRSGLDQPQRLVVNYVYQFPFHKDQTGLLGRFVGGWEIAGITTESTGTPYTVFNSYNALGTIPSSQLTLQGATQRVSINPNGVPGTAPGPGVTNPYFIPNLTNSGIVGTLGRNTERTGGTNNFNVSAQKDFRLGGERHHLQFRWELFDLMKHRNFTTIPAYTVTTSTNAATFLNLGQTSVGGRSMQFLMRYSF